jgi:hypothetical protein
LNVEAIGKIQGPISHEISGCTEFHGLDATHLHRAETSTNRNWRFTFKDGPAYVLDYEDYH